MPSMTVDAHATIVIILQEAGATTRQMKDGEETVSYFSFL
jgi:hypothetical protein